MVDIFRGGLWGPAALANGQADKGGYGNNDSDDIKTVEDTSHLFLLIWFDAMS